MPLGLPRFLCGLSFLYDHNGNLRHREGRPRFSSHMRQTGDAEELRQRGARGAHIRDQLDCRTMATHESPYPLRKPFHGEGEGAGVAFLPWKVERQALAAAGTQVDRSLGLHSAIAEVRDLRPDEHSVHVVGTAMNGGEVSNPQGIL